MLELQKTVLINVSFSDELFKKELRKASKWLSKAELVHLRKWMEEHFSDKLIKLSEEVFQPQAA
jgi:hypothetical protein